MPNTSNFIALTKVFYRSLRYSHRRRFTKIAPTMKLTLAAAVAVTAFCSSALAYSGEHGNALHARDAYDTAPDLYARDAWAEPEDDEFELNAREADPDADADADAEADDDLDIHPRDAYLAGYQDGLTHPVRRRSAGANEAAEASTLERSRHALAPIMADSGPVHLYKNLHHQGGDAFKEFGHDWRMDTASRHHPVKVRRGLNPRTGDGPPPVEKRDVRPPRWQ